MTVFSAFVVHQTVVNFQSDTSDVFLKVA